MPTARPWRSAFWHTTLLCIALSVPTVPAAAATTQPTAADLETEYQTVLSEMKHPPSTGILVTEIEPDSPAGAAGLQPGDIIYHYAGASVRDLDTLRKKVADIFASNLTASPLDPNSTADNKVLLGIHRADQDLILQLPRAPLGIRAIEIEAGVPVTPNPPPSPRGSITLGWSDLARKIAPNAPPTFYRTTDSSDSWTGWQRRALLPGSDDYVAQFENHHVDPATGETLASESINLRLRTGDYESEPAFLFDSLDESLHTTNYAIITFTAQRVGLNLRTQGKISYPTRVLLQPQTDRPCPLDSIPEPALPLLAAAMPQQDGAALQLHLLNFRDFLPRPGYLVITRGKQKIPTQSTPAWRVDLLHCGVTIETYWLDNNRQLLQFDSPTTTLTTRRVPTLEDASLPAAPRPARASATQP